MKIVILVLAITVLFSCSKQPDDKQQPTQSVEASSEETKNNPVSVSEEETRKLKQLFAEHDEAFLKLNPVFATFRGDSRYNDQLGDYLSDDYLKQTVELDRKYLAAVNNIDLTKLSSMDKTSARIFKYNREVAIKGYEQGIAKKGTMLPISQFFSIPTFMVGMGSGSSIQPFNTVEDYDNWLKRAGDFGSWMDQAILNMDEGIKAGVVQPKILMEKALPQIKGQVADSAEQSLFYMPIRNLPADFSEADKKRLTDEYTSLIEGTLIPAYKRMADYIESTYLPNSRETIGLSSLPDGKAWYEYQANTSTTTELTPQQIHDIGKAEAERLYKEMQLVKESVGFEGTMQEFFQFLRTDPQFYYDDPDELIAEYDALKTKINAALPKLFNIMPKADYEVRPVPEYQERTMATAYYMPATPDGSRPGVFFANTYDLKARPKYTMEALSIHEANPGHHFQTSIASEQENLPNFRRFGGFTAYVEGWGLYTESLGKDLGVYTDPYQYFGALTFNIWRANRLVVDTGMHYLGWSREQAIEWMMSNAPITETDVISEVERYIAIPGQALAYKIGELKILELRAMAEKALGDKFDIREFHTQVLINGPVPLAVLEENINDWVAESK